MRRRQPGARQSRFGYYFFTPFLLVFAAAIAAPLLYAVYLSLFQDRLVGGTVFAGLDNYRRALSDELFRAGLARVALFLVVQVPIMLGLALLAALAIDSGRLRWPALFRIGSSSPTRTRRGGRADVGLPVRAEVRSGASDRQCLRGHASGPAVEVLGPRLHRKHQYMGVRRLQHADPLRRAAGGARGAVRGRVDGRRREIRKAVSIKIPALRQALLLTTIFSIIGSFQLFNEPNVLQSLAPGVITTYYTPNMYAYNLAFNGQEYKLLRRDRGHPRRRHRHCRLRRAAARQPNGARTVSAATTARAHDARADKAHRASTRARQASQTRRRRAGRRSTPLTVAMLLMLAYTLLPLFWLLMSSTKDGSSLFSSFGLWFGHGFTCSPTSTAC